MQNTTTVMSHTSSKDVIPINVFLKPVWAEYSSWNTVLILSLSHKTSKVFTLMYGLSSMILTRLNLSLIPTDRISYLTATPLEWCTYDSSLTTLALLFSDVWGGNKGEMGHWGLCQMNKLLKYSTLNQWRLSSEKKST